MQNDKGRSNIIKSVDRLIGFYVLALLIVESLLTGNGIWAKTATMQYFCIISGILLFIALLTLVTYMCINHYKTTMYTPDDHLKEKAIYGKKDDEKTKGAIFAPVEAPTGYYTEVDNV
ncbi:MAG: hypothetical protein PHI59_01270 [Candidatus Omnitrophica bacterium]|nr:hypothetical protein [Candidatus Omnitrophota bacterium]